METRTLGASGLQVSEIGLGCNNFGTRIDKAETKTVVDAAIDHGINFFDTADVYGNTQSETLLGHALGGRRQEVIVATKFGLPVGGGEHRRGGSRRWLMQAVEESLRRLDTDYIDLYQFHFPDPATPVEETLRTLDDLVTQGKVRYIGCSNFAGWQIADAHWLARQAHGTAFISAQNPYSLLDRKVEAEVLPACERFNLGFLPYFPLASGLLTGKYHHGEKAPEGSRMASWKQLADMQFTEDNLRKVENLRQWTESHGRNLLELAFGWLLSNPRVSSVIAGATRAEQIQANVAARSWRLTQEELGEIDGLLKQ